MNFLHAVRPMASFLAKKNISQTVATSFIPSSTRLLSISNQRFNIEQQQIINSTPKVPVHDLTPLKLDSDLYAVIKVHNNPFLVTEGDKVILPYNLKTAQVGDVLHFNDVSTIGSRNYTFYQDKIDSSLYTIKAIVLEKTKLPMRVNEVTKRRNRKVRHAISKPHRTILRVTDIKLN